MRVWNRNSLKFKLTRQLVLWQVMALVSFGLIAAVPLSHMTTGFLLDPRTPDRIADSIKRVDGNLVIEATPELRQIQQEYPRFWFYVTDLKSDGVTYGIVPEEMQKVVDNIAFIASASFGNADLRPGDYVLIRTVRTQAGELRIAMGKGPTFDGFSISTLLSNGYFVGFTAALSLLLVIMIPITLRQSLRGVDRVAEEARGIDVDQPGVRLSADKIPEEVHPLVLAVNEALERLDEGIEKRHRFMADAAHELRTPIAILQMRVDLLAPSPERDQLQLDIARLSNLADQLLDLQRIDMGQFRIDTFNLVELAEEVTADLAPIVINIEGELEFQTEARTIMVEGDRLAIGRALTNLIQNAITHTGAKAHVVVSVNACGAVTVSDNGPGIPADQRQKVFEPFYRVKPNQSGTGLGLNLVQEIVWRHHGTVRVSDSKLGGVAFTIDLGAGKARQAGK